MWLSAEPGALFYIDTELVGGSVVSAVHPRPATAAPILVWASGHDYSTPAVPPVISACNVNADATTDVADVQTIINQALGVDLPLYDLNFDGVTNVVDAQIDMDAAVGLGCSADALWSNSSSSALSVRPSVRSSARPASGSTTTTATRGLLDNAVDIGSLGSLPTKAYGINNLGQVVGRSGTQRPITASTPDAVGPAASSGHAFVWASGQMTDLAVPANRGSFDSVAHAVNDVSQAVGTSSKSPFDRAGFLYTRGGGGWLDTVPNGSASAINGEGQVVGYFSLASHPEHAFLWRGGTVRDLGTLGGSSSRASAINGIGEVVGSADIPGNTASHAFLFSGAALIDLSTLGGTNSAAYGINAAGSIVGSSQTTGNQSRHAFIYRAGAMTDLGTLGGPDSQADGINNSGIVVGWAMTPNGRRHAVVWGSGRAVDINSFAKIGGSATLEEATAINDVGQVVANGNNGHAYLVTLPAELR